MELSGLIFFLYLRKELSELKINKKIKNKNKKCKSHFQKKGTFWTQKMKKKTSSEKIYRKILKKVFVIFLEELEKSQKPKFLQLLEETLQIHFSKISLG